jgi:GNAT superfamily N-acetyltransferase
MNSRVRMKLSLERHKVEDRWPCGSISHDDIEALGLLMLEAYRGTIDYEGETLEEAISEVRGTLEGKYGTFLSDCSYMIEERGEAVSASMVTFSEELKQPLLAFSMTHPDFKRQGMAVFLLKKTINALADRGFEDLYLVVTDGNVEAQDLYRKMGFKKVE